MLTYSSAKNNPRIRGLRIPCVTKAGYARNPNFCFFIDGVCLKGTKQWYKAARNQIALEDIGKEQAEVRAMAREASQVSLKFNKAQNEIIVNHAWRILRRIHVGD
jgi:hypothetical protein